MAEVMRVDPLSAAGSDARPARPLPSGFGSPARRSFAALLASMLMLAACAEIGEPDLGVGSVPPTSLSDVGDGVAEAAADSETDNSTEEPEATPLPVFSPPRPDGYVPSLAIVGEDSTVIVDDASADFTAGTDPDAEDVPVAQTLSLDQDVVPVRIVDDFFGGLVIEDVRPDDEGVEQLTITWLRPADPVGTVVATGVGLLDVGFIDSTLEAHALVSVGGVAVERIKLVDGERAPFASLIDGQTLVDLSASEGLHAVIVADAGCGDLLFWNSSGEVVDVGGPATPPCAVDRRPSYGAVDLSPDAALVAYTVLTYRSDGVVATTDVVVRELGSGAVVFTSPIGAVGQEVTALSFDGARLAFIRQDSEVNEVVVLSTDGESPETIVPVDLVAVEAVFARQPLVVGRTSETNGEDESADG